MINRTGARVAGIKRYSSSGDIARSEASSGRPFDLSAEGVAGNRLAVLIVSPPSSYCAASITDYNIHPATFLFTRETARLSLMARLKLEINLLKKTMVKAW